MKTTFVSALLLIALAGGLSWGGTGHSAEKGVGDPAPLGTGLFRIAFGSCNRYELGQSHWNTIAAHRPDIWIWMGDIVYGDTNDTALLRQRFDHQKAVPEYHSFAASTRVVGVWDDHDFGENNLDGNIPDKAVRQEILLDFLDEPPESERRSREGIFTAYDINAEGTLVRVILLDLRYFRNVPPQSGNLLGTEQWAWLKSELRESAADVNLLVSSTQVLRESTRKETWAEWPAERARLFDLIASSRARNVILLSGDLHAAELSRIDLAGLEAPLYEITSSGLTHNRDWSLRFLPNPYREALYLGKNFGQLDVVRAEDGLVAYARIFGVDDRVQIAKAIKLRP